VSSVTFKCKYSKAYTRTVCSEKRCKMYVCVLYDVYTTASNDHLSTAPTEVKDRFFMKDARKHMYSYTIYTCSLWGGGGSTHRGPPASLILYNTISDL